MMAKLLNRRAKLIVAGIIRELDIHAVKALDDKEILTNHPS